MSPDNADQEHAGDRDRRRGDPEPVPTAAHKKNANANANPPPRDRRKRGVVRGRHEIQVRLVGCAATGAPAPTLLNTWFTVRPARGVRDPQARRPARQGAGACHQPQAERRDGEHGDAPQGEILNLVGDQAVALQQPVEGVKDGPVHSPNIGLGRSLAKNRPSRRRSPATRVENAPARSSDGLRTDDRAGAAPSVILRDPTGGARCGSW